MVAITKLLVANRGECAIRIMQAAAGLGVNSVAIYSQDDAQALHPHKADESVALNASGATAYLDIEQIIQCARQTQCDAIHPGYGFLSENADFARRCAEENILFVGPSPQVLDLFGHKARARAHALSCGVPLLPGSEGVVSLDSARAFLAGLKPGNAMLIKAVAGGGGRGMRVVHEAAELDEAYTRCASEAQQAFGNAEVYVEAFLPRARHIEIQILGDGDQVCHLWERECSIQRRHQKIVELAPAASLSVGLRDKLIDAALRMARGAHYNNIGTFEFLVDAAAEDPSKSGGLPETATFAFIEANPRLQVEHTVTEQITGIDLVQSQLRLAAGERLSALGFHPGEPPPVRGYAMQCRINMETLAADGSVKPASGTITSFAPPFGSGIRLDTQGFIGYSSNPRFDSLLAKLVVHSPLPDYSRLVDQTYRALCEFNLSGINTNLPLLQNLLRHEAFRNNAVYTRFVDEHIAELASADSSHRQLFAFSKPVTGQQTSAGTGNVTSTSAEPPGTQTLRAPMQGTVIAIALASGDSARLGQEVLVMEAMKMEHVIGAEIAGTVHSLAVAPGDTVFEGDPLVFIAPATGELTETAGIVEEEVDLDDIRPDLAEVIERHRLIMDAARPDAVARRRKRNQRTARENISDLVDADTFLEFGGLTIAGRRLRNTVDELIKRTPADGLVTGIGQINGEVFPVDSSRCAVMAYDYTVFAGTQGYKNHEKKDRLFEVALRRRLPLILFSEGGGGRPGDTDLLYSGWLHLKTFHQFADLNGLVPMVGISSGYCFAGNAVLLGCCDVIIATENANIGMGGPAMIEGGGLGVYHPTDVGPMSDQVPNGVVDIAVKDEAEAVDVAKKYLSYFQGPVGDWDCIDQRWLRRAVPENRLRVYDVRAVIETLADTGSVLELRAQFGLGIITAFARMEGKPLAIIANNPQHLGGAIDSPAADKAARFMQLCDAFDIPILFLCDTPGNMVGPEAEKTALVRHCCRLFVIGANLTVPFFTVVMRKAYGLGSQGMAGGGFHNPLFSVAWPTAEFGPMGLEGAVKLGRRADLEAIEDPAEREKVYEQMVAELYEQGKALSAASYFEIDDVIDPADTRRWIMNVLDMPHPKKQRIEGKKHAWIDVW